MKKSESQDIADFYAKIGEMVHNVPGHLSEKKLDERIVFIEEEFMEFRDAAGAQDLEQMADALIDMVYVIKGTALMLGLPWERLWDEVHRANMAKEPGSVKGRMRRDAIKPPHWKPPQLMAILVDAGYDEEIAKYEGNHRDDEL